MQSPTILSPLGCVPNNPHCIGGFGPPGKSLPTPQVPDKMLPSPCAPSKALTAAAAYGYGLNEGQHWGTDAMGISLKKGIKTPVVAAYTPVPDTTFSDIAFTFDVIQRVRGTEPGTTREFGAQLMVGTRWDWVFDFWSLSYSWKAYTSWLIANEIVLSTNFTPVTFYGKSDRTVKVDYAVYGYTRTFQVVMAA